MTSAKQDGAMNAWTVYDHIDECRGKVALKERDHRAYYESSQVDKQFNEVEIAALRQNNKDKRVNLAQQTFHGDERVINEALESHRDENLALRRKTAEEAISEMDQKMCEKEKQLNSLREQREKRENRIKELETALARLDLLAKNSDNNYAQYDLKTIRMVENNLDKARIKHETARKLQQTYIEIVRCLEEERLSLPKKLKALEGALEEQRHELRELTGISQDARIKRDQAKAELSVLEQTMIEAKRSRDRTLTRMKKQAEKQKEMADKIEKRARATLQTDDPSQESKRQSQMDEDNWVKVTTYEEAFKRIQEATGVSSIEEIEARFMNQGGTYEHLLAQKRTSEKQRKWLSEQKRQLTQHYEAMKYSGESKMSQGQQMLEKMQEHLGKTEQRRDLLRNSVHRNHMVTTDVKNGIRHLYDTLKDIKLKPPMKNNANPDDYLDQLQICENKLQKLMTQANVRDSASFKKIMNSTEFHEFMENRQKTENLRVRLDEPDSYDSDDFGYDSQDNEDMMTNADIKREGQMLMDQKKNKKRARGRRKK
ncbi:coiled-coil domain-containing protein 151-like [Patiria miniata]|uniref:ODAD1 central coiled coil region domain-containing protein n=1 Tax=Patiria miniata TaxID=46514 RepID=A0A914AIZ8_PATMI|nr:coiled-coil domain-containing protein 151-like [Patiria miniata]